jgi:ABC-type Fe3+ transport system permease subunit
MFVVRTAAEEVYLALNQGGEDDVLHAAIVAAPTALLFWLGVILFGPFVLRASRPGEAQARSRLIYRLGVYRWSWLVVVLAAVFLVVGVPLVSISWRTGYQSETVGWSPTYFASGLENAIRTSGTVVAGSLLTAAVAASLTATLAFLACWCVAADTRWGRHLQAVLFCGAGLLWVIPGPVVGIGLSWFFLSLDRLNVEWLSSLVYHGPSHVPYVCAYLIRTFPFALALLWPALRMVPRDLRDSARVDGTTRLGTLLRVTLPLTAGAFVATVLAVTALALSEVAASKAVATPGTSTFTLAVFDRMHYGVSQDVSALSLLLLAVLFTGGTEAGLRWAALRAGRPRRGTPRGEARPAPPAPHSAPPPR